MPLAFYPDFAVCVLRLQEAAIPTVESLRLLDFHFSDFGLPEETTSQATVRMFLDLKLVQDFNIDYKVTDLLIILLCAASLLKKNPTQNAHSSGN